VQAFPLPASETSNTQDQINQGGSSDTQADDGTVLFMDPDSDFAARDVFDVDDEIVRFVAQRQVMIWMEDNTEFENWDVNGNLLLAGAFEVRFGTTEGQRRAFFSEPGLDTICNLVVQNGQLSIFRTSQPIPQE